MKSMVDNFNLIEFIGQNINDIIKDNNGYVLEIINNKLLNEDDLSEVFEFEITKCFDYPGKFIIDCSEEDYFLIKFIIYHYLSLQMEHMDYLFKQIKYPGDGVFDIRECDLNNDLLNSDIEKLKINIGLFINWMVKTHYIYSLNENNFNKVKIDLKNILDSKSNDYATVDNILSNFNQSLNLFLTQEQSIVIRLFDKQSRLKELMDKDKIMKVKDEKIEDTIHDFINYSFLLYLIRYYKKISIPLKNKDNCETFIYTDEGYKKILYVNIDEKNNNIFNNVKIFIFKNLFNR